MVQDQKEISLSTLSLCGSGGIASAVFGAAIAYFTLLYYNNALGVSGATVGIALTSGMIFDAFSDPLVGLLSDRTRTRWGRRHPYMYAAILPSAFLFYLLWNPPQWALSSDSSAFLWLVGIMISIRLAYTMFDVPLRALAPELTTRYDEHTDLMNYHANIGGVVSVVWFTAIYMYWLKDTPEHTNGVLNVAGYEGGGLVSAVMIALAMLACTAEPGALVAHAGIRAGVPINRHSCRDYLRLHVDF